MSKKSQKQSTADTTKGRKDGAKKSAKKDEKAQVGPWRKARENAEAVLVAIILALIIRHFSLEAFEIPTGSMAPALNGVHIQSTCPNCDTTVDIGIETLPSGHVDNRLNARKAFLQDEFLYEGNCPDCGCRIEDRTPGQPTQAHCPNCNMKKPTTPSGFRGPMRLGVITAHCPNCTMSYKEVYEVKPGRFQFGSDAQGGHKILVNKFLYKVREPRRWEVIVFHFNRQRNYIKRLIGLPGETLEVRDGDIWINGEIERKPQWAQDELWYQVHDSDIAEQGYVRTKAWRFDKGWKESEEAGFDFNGLDKSTAMTYQREIRDRVPYSSMSADPHSTLPRVYDLRLLANITVNGGDGQLRLEVINGDATFACAIPARAAGTKAEPGSLEARSSDGTRRTELGQLGDLVLEHKQAYEIEFFVAERQLVLRVGGETIAEQPLPPEWSDTKKGQNFVRLVADGVGGVLQRVRVARDNYYTDPNPGFGRPSHGVGGIPAVLGEDDYFAMGDNSRHSLDSRYWGALHRDNLLGRAFIIFWPALPWHWELGFIR
ncbi:MAG: signal peptidase I [Planctomycetota bacterium]